MAQACLHKVHVFNYICQEQKLKVFWCPLVKRIGLLRRETIMIGFILLWNQKWEANSIVSVYMHDEASKQIFNRDWDWEYYPFFFFSIIFAKASPMLERRKHHATSWIKTIICGKNTKPKIIQLAQVQVLPFSFFADIFGIGPHYFLNL